MRETRKPVEDFCAAKEVADWKTSEKDEEKRNTHSHNPTAASRGEARDSKQVKQGASVEQVRSESLLLIRHATIYRLGVSSAERRGKSFRRWTA